MMFKRMLVMATIAAMASLSTQSLEAVTYVTDTGGYAYDESRAATNLAPAIGLATVAIVGIIAIAVQNSHGSSSSSSHYGYCPRSSYSCYDYSDCCSSYSSSRGCYSYSNRFSSYSRSCDRHNSGHRSSRHCDCR